MNLIPFVTLFIFIASFTFLSMLKEEGRSVKEKKLLSEFFKQDRKRLYHLEENAYHAKYQQEREKKKETGDPQNITRPKKWPKRDTPRQPMAKFNLAYLKHVTGKKTAKRLFQILYGEAEFFKDVRLDKIFKKIIDNIESDPSLEELFPYEMLKGTKKAYPPLSEFFILDKKREAIYFRNAAPEVIRAHFGEKLAKKIFVKETKNTLTKEELALITPSEDLLNFRKSE